MGTQSTISHSSATQTFNNNNNHNYLTEIPPEIFMLICEKLGDPKGLFNLLRVCRKFNSYLCSSHYNTQHIWRLVRKNHFPDFTEIAVSSYKDEREYVRHLLGKQCRLCGNLHWGGFNELLKRTL